MESKTNKISIIVITVLLVICGILSFKVYSYRKELINCNEANVLNLKEEAKSNTIVMYNDSVFKAQELLIDTLKLENERLEEKTYEYITDPLQERINDSINSSDSAQLIITKELLERLNGYIR